MSGYVGVCDCERQYIYIVCLAVYTSEKTSVCVCVCVNLYYPCYREGLRDYKHRWEQQENYFFF